VAVVASKRRWLGLAFRSATREPQSQALNAGELVEDLKTKRNVIRVNYIFFMPYFTSAGLMVSKNFNAGLILALICIPLLYLPFFDSLRKHKSNLIHIGILMVVGFVLGVMVQLQIGNLSLIRFIMFVVIFYVVFKIKLVGTEQNVQKK
jgi:hypothetical protein